MLRRRQGFHFLLIRLSGFNQWWNFSPITEDREEKKKKQAAASTAVKESWAKLNSIVLLVLCSFGSSLIWHGLYTLSTATKARETETGEYKRKATHAAASSTSVCLSNVALWPFCAIFLASWFPKVAPSFYQALFFNLIQNDVSRVTSFS